MSDTLEAEDLPQTLRNCLAALDDRKAIDVVILDVRNRSTITDYLVIASGTSDPHVRALLNTATRQLKEDRAGTILVDFEPEAGWGVVDAVDFMVHVFEPAQRAHFQLESLWGDAPRAPIGEVMETDV